MLTTTWILAAATLAQVPAPGADANDSATPRAEVRALLASEASRLRDLAESLTAQGRTADADGIRALIAPEPGPEGPTRFVPLPELVPAPRPEPAAPLRDAEPIRAESARAFFDLARRSHEIGRYALADDCLRAVIERQPDHSEARRLLGFVAHEGGWATPFAVLQLRAGRVSHPTYGWVPADWLPRLDRGELPAPPSASGPTTWLPADMADALRRDWKPPWEITTEHFQILTNVPMSEAITFGRRLEDFYALFFGHLADLIGPELPLARRFRDPDLVASAPKTRHRVFYFATKAEYVDYLRTRLRIEGFDQTLGVYFTPEMAKRAGFSPSSYFFKDEDGQIEAQATLFHEVSHQLLFESRRSRYNSRVGHYWVFEGLGTYFETVDPRPDGSIQVGGRVGPRFETARKRLVDDGELVPIARLATMDKVAFNGERGGDVFLNYAEAMALTHFLMQAEDGRHRDAFLAYVESIFRGSAGRSLSERLDLPYADLEAQLLAYLKSP